MPSLNPILNPNPNGPSPNPCLRLSMRRPALPLRMERPR